MTIATAISQSCDLEIAFISENLAFPPIWSRAKKSRFFASQRRYLEKFGVGGLDNEIALGNWNFEIFRLEKTRESVCYNMHRGDYMAKEIVCTTMDRDLIEKARAISRKRKVSVSALLERALDRYLPLLDDADERYQQKFRGNLKFEK